jgi:hypothetical protein
MLIAPGDIAIEVRVFTATGTVTLALPLTPSRVAVMVAEPEDCAVASPAELIFATAAFEVVQATVAVTSAVELSL